MTTLLKSATIIDSSSPFHKKKKDILITNGKISKIANDITPKENYNVIELDNLHVCQGWFDTSVSLGEPGYEERETIKNGLTVAATSGFTDIAVNPNTFPVTDNKASVEFLTHKALQHVTNLYPIGALTQKSKGVEMAEMYDMKKSGAIAFGDYKKPISNDNLLKISLLYAQNFDGLVLSFPKNLAIAGDGVANEGVQSTTLGLKGIPALAEELQIARDLFILEYTGGKMHIPTISTKKSVELIKEAKRKGLHVTCSVAVHNLFLTDNELDNFDGNKKVNPPLRTNSDVSALVKGVNEGVIDIITTDHNPIDIENKKVEFSTAMDGTIGLESAFGVLNSIFDIETIVKCLCTNPKKIFGIPIQTIQENENASLTLFNPSKEYNFSIKNIYSSSKNSAFLGASLHGITYGVYNNKQLLLKK